MQKYDTIVLNEQSKTPLYVQLYRVLRKQIETDQLLPNEQLPTIRHLAKQLGVNRITVVNAYNLLAKQGLIYKKVGSGSFVSKLDFEPFSAHLSPEQASELAATHGDDTSINFARTTPSEHLFPVAAFKDAINHVLERDMGGAFSYRDSLGYAPLRSAFCARILKPAGIRADKDNIQVLSGAQQGIDVVAKALVQHGDTVIVESPSYTGAITIFKSRGARVVELPLEHDGPNMMTLRAHIYQYKPKLLYIMPNLHNPTGVIYSAKKCREIIELSNKHQLMVLEDDYCSELYRDKQGAKPLKAYCGSDYVIYLKSVSKSIMPGLRLGFMYVPKAIMNRVIMAKQTTDIATSGLTQRAFELFITSGEYDRQRLLMKSALERRYALAKARIVGDMQAIFTLENDNGGLSFWLKLHGDLSSKALYQKLKAQGVLITQGHAFYVNKDDSPYFRLTIADVEPENIEKGLHLIAKTVQQLYQARGYYDEKMVD